MLDEIKYLQPEIILLDGRAFSEAKTLLPKIRSTAGKKVHIYIFGLKLSKELKQKLHKKYNIYCYEKIPLLIEKSINKMATIHSKDNEDTKYELDVKHPFSSVSISTKAIIEKWHSKQMRIVTNRKVGNYAMLNINSASIGNNFPLGIWSKVSQTKGNDQQNISNMPYASDILFSSPSTNEIVKISKTILPILCNIYLKYYRRRVKCGAIYEERSQASQETLDLGDMQFHKNPEAERDPEDSMNLFFRLTGYYNKRRSEIRLFIILAIFVSVVFYALSNYKEIRKKIKSSAADMNRF